MSLLLLTPTLGCSSWLPETIETAASAAKDVPMQQVLVAPPDAVEALQLRWPVLKVLADAPGGGVYGAINAGAAAVGDWRWLTWINDDDRLLPGFAELWRRVQAAPDSADVWYGDVDYIDEAGTQIAAMPVCRQPADVPALLASGVAPFSQQGALISAELWRRLGGIDASLRIAGDLDFWVRAASIGARFRYCPSTVAEFRIRAGQLSSEVGRAEAEIATVLGRRDLRVGRWRARLAVARFRSRNLLRILARVGRTGRLGSRAMFSR